jgi:hypothetical protein
MKKVVRMMTDPNDAAIIDALAPIGNISMT